MQKYVDFLPNITTGFGAETDAALLKFVHDDGKGIVWFHGSAVQADDWGYPEECNIMRGAKLSVPTGLRPRPWGAWINNYGEGRSFTITIGHDMDTFRRIEFIRMFPRGVEWAARGKVTLEGPDRRGERCWPYYNHEG